MFIPYFIYKRIIGSTDRKSARHNISPLARSGVWSSFKSKSSSESSLWLRLLDVDPGNIILLKGDNYEISDCKEKFINFYIASFEPCVAICK